MIAKSILVHAIILALATGSASYVWLRDKAPAASVRRDVVVWRGKAADVDRLEFTKPARHVILEGKSDSAGRYFVGTATNEKADGEGHGQGTVTFVSVAGAQKIADKVGELRALRDLGKLAGDKLKELGFETPDGRAIITVHGQAHTLELGMLAPGGSDRYVREIESGSVFVVDADPLKELEAGERSLVEKDLHEFPLDPDVDKVTISRGPRKRVVVRRGSGARHFFADPVSPDTNDESVTTWMSKVERLKPADFILGEPVGVTSDKLRLEYAGAKGSLGFTEVVQAAPIAGGDADIFVRSERTRLWAKVAKTVGEQVLADSTTVIH